MNDPMNVLRNVLVAVLISVVSGWSCSDDSTPDEPIDMTPDATTMVADAGLTPDSGVLGLCPEPSNFPAGTMYCPTLAECGMQGSPQSSCAYCLSFSDSICSLGQCSTPQRLGVTEGVQIEFNITGLASQVMSFAGFAVATETAGGTTLTCEDVYNDNWDRTTLEEPCLNRIDSRFQNNQGGVAQKFTLRFGSFPGGRRVLFIIYGFSQTGAEGDPVGISCTEVDVHEAGTRTTDLEEEGDNMRPIQ